MRRKNLFIYILLLIFAGPLGVLAADAKKPISLIPKKSSIKIGLGSSLSTTGTVAAVYFGGVRGDYCEAVIVQNDGKSFNVRMPLAEEDFEAHASATVCTTLFHANSSQKKIRVTGKVESLKGSYSNGDLYAGYLAIDRIFYFRDGEATLNDTLSEIPEGAIDVKVMQVLVTPNNPKRYCSAIIRAYGSLHEGVVELPDDYASLDSHVQEGVLKNMASICDSLSASITSETEIRIMGDLLSSTSKRVEHLSKYDGITRTYTSPAF
ncbi:MAG: hypothetical protein Q7T11_08395 [Deltaproteobacteria bacterium]|nr:hypothetical protein [Deltaproteobacteria bacterium]